MTIHLPPIVITHAHWLTSNGRYHWQDKTHCPHGHEYTPENTRITTRGARACRTCERARNREKARACIYNPPTPCESCGKVLRKGNLPKHYRAFHPNISAALGIETP